MKLQVTINGKQQTIEMDGSEILLDLLRREGYFGVKRGCENGDCGSCAVMVDGRAICSCLMMAGQVEGRQLLTCEGLGDPVNPHPLQDQFVQCGAAQCGFCIPGMIVAAKELIDDHPEPTFDQMKEALDGNLCRCTGYVKQFEAVRDAAAIMAKDPKPKSSGPKGLARPAKAPAVVFPAAPSAPAKAAATVKKAAAKVAKSVAKVAKKAVAAVKKAVAKKPAKPAKKPAKAAPKKAAPKKAAPKKAAKKPAKKGGRR